MPTHGPYSCELSNTRRIWSTLSFLSLWTEIIVVSENDRLIEFWQRTWCEFAHLLLCPLEASIPTCGLGVELLRTRSGLNRLAAARLAYTGASYNLPNLLLFFVATNINARGRGDGRRANDGGLLFCLRLGGQRRGTRFDLRKAERALRLICGLG